MLITVSQSLQPGLPSQVIQHRQKRPNLSLQGWGRAITTVRKQRGIPGIRKNLIFVTFAFIMLYNNETSRIPRLERGLIKVTQWNHQYDANLLPLQASLGSYVPLDILFTLTEIKAGGKAKTVTTINPEANGNEYKQAMSLHTPTILKYGKLLLVK